MNYINSDTKKFLVAVFLILLLGMLSACGEQAPPLKSQDNAPDQSQATQPSAEANPENQAQDGAGVVDSGFRPGPDGFSFENYGNDGGVKNMTPAEMKRMFGDKVCATQQGDACTLIPPAQQIMEQVNDAMKNGHCEGMAVLSEVFYTKNLDPAQYGSSVVKELILKDNEPLQREIAYWFVTQLTSPVSESKIYPPPAEVVDILAKTFADPTIPESYTVGIYKPDMSGGHGITPYEVVDKGNGLYWIMVYDNNYPGQELYIVVDKNANTWQYEGATMAGFEKDIYNGDATTKNLELTPLSARLGQQVCDFCSQPQSSNGSGLAATKPLFNQIWMDGQAQLLLVDEKGRKFGYENGKFLRDIPEADFDALLTGRVGDANPIYYMPVGMKFSAIIDGKQVDKKNPVDLVMIGPGYYIGIEGIMLASGEKDTVVFDGSGKSLSYKTSDVETPVMIFGIEGQQYDYVIDVKANDVKSDTETIIEYEPTKGTLALRSSSPEEGVYYIAISRISDTDVETFETSDEGVVLPPAYTIHFNLKDWAGQGKALGVLYDLNGDGSIEEEKDIEGRQ